MKVCFRPFVITCRGSFSLGVGRRGIFDEGGEREKKKGRKRGREGERDVEKDRERQREGAERGRETGREKKG